MQLGHWQLDTVDGGRFKLDGGACFGVVPKTVWSKLFPADEENRITLANNCVLARDGKHTILIETGYGGKYGPLDRAAFGLRAGCPVLESLQTLGVRPEEIDLVVLGHLHFDHAGGITRLDEQRRLVLTFPNARHVVHRFEWEDAVGGRPELLAAYPQDNLTPLIDSDRLRLVDDEETIVPGLLARRTGGHTRGHTALMFESGGETACYIGDLCPTTEHMRQLWCLSYDTFLLITRRKKQEMLLQAAEQNWWMLWTHDIHAAASRVTLRNRKFQVADPLPTL